MAWRNSLKRLVAITSKHNANRRITVEHYKQQEIREKNGYIEILGLKTYCGSKKDGFFYKILDHFVKHMVQFGTLTNHYDKDMEKFEEIIVGFCQLLGEFKRQVAMSSQKRQNYKYNIIVNSEPLITNIFRFLPFTGITTTITYSNGVVEERHIKIDFRGNVQTVINKQINGRNYTIKIRTDSNGNQERISITCNLEPF